MTIHRCWLGAATATLALTAAAGSKLGDSHSPAPVQSTVPKCDLAVVPVRDIFVSHIYQDPANSIVDPVLKARHDQEVRQVYDFLRSLMRFLDNGNVRCVLVGLEQWAAAEAWLGMMGSQQASFERKWMVNGLAMIYSHVQQQASPDQAKAIELWFKRLVREVIRFSNHYRGPRNNHYYWEGAVVSVVGRLSKDALLMQWGSQVFEDAMKQVQHDGTLPLELARGQRALHYHAHSAAALSLMASVLDKDAPQLHLLVDLVARNSFDPEIMTRLAKGIMQIPLADHDFAWLAIYQRRYPRADVNVLLSSNAHMEHVFLGGSTRRRSPLETAFRP